MAIALHPKFPIPDRSRQQVRRTKGEDGVIDVGWCDGALSDGRAFRAEMWAQDQVSMLTFFFSVVGLENLSNDEMTALVVREGLVAFREGPRYCGVRAYPDDAGNVLWSVNIVVGDEDHTYLSDSVPIFGYSKIGEPNAMLNPTPIKAAHAKAAAMPAQGGDHAPGQDGQSESDKLEAVLEELRDGEPPLKIVSPATDWAWLLQAYQCLEEIDRKRGQGVSSNSCFCIFAAGPAYVQFLAEPASNRLRAEAVSGKSVPETAAILTPEKTALLTELGFVDDPAVSPNYIQIIAVRGRSDLVGVTRLAFRTLREVYGVADLSAVEIKKSIPVNQSLEDGGKSGRTNG